MGPRSFPVHVINAEWVIPFNFTLRPLDRLMERLFDVPFLPLPGAAIAITLPWAWYLALPARMIFVVGEPLDMRSLLRDEGVTDFECTDRVDRAKIKRVAERVRRKVQRELDVHVERYGRRPYQARSLMRALRGARRGGLLGRVLPTNWAVNFNRAHRDEYRGPARGRLHAILRDWDLLGFFLPLGWPFLSLTRALRKPPCGYRGLSRAEPTPNRGALRLATGGPSVALVELRRYVVATERGDAASGLIRFKQQCFQSAESTVQPVGHRRARFLALAEHRIHQLALLLEDVDSQADPVSLEDRLQLITAFE